MHPAFLSLRLLPTSHVAARGRCLRATLGWCLLLGLGLGAGALLNAGENDWPQFRGPHGDGTCDVQGIPARWTAADIAWSASLPGVGHSSPVVQGERVFVTTASADGSTRQLVALNLKDGKQLWTRGAQMGAAPLHAKNSHASSTPAVDEERVYALFSDDNDLVATAYTLDGELAWRQSLGHYASQHGFGASPIVFEDLLIVPNDQDGPSAIVAFDRRNGAVVWSCARPSREASYATPAVVDVPGQKPQLICLAGATGLTSLDPWSGEINWFTAPLPKRTVGTPVFASGLVLATCGQGAKGALLIGVDPSGRGSVEATHVKLRLDRGLPYVPTPVAKGDLLFLWGDAGVVCCQELPSGKSVWQQRIGGTYSGSPLLADGKLINMTETGEVVVLSASREFAELGRTALDDPSHASPAAVPGYLLLRTFHRLTAVRATAPKTTSRPE